MPTIYRTWGTLRTGTSPQAAGSALSIPFQWFRHHAYTEIRPACTRACVVRRLQQQPYRWGKTHTRHKNRWVTDCTTRDIIQWESTEKGPFTQSPSLRKRSTRCRATHANLIFPGNNRLKLTEFVQTYYNHRIVQWSFPRLSPTQWGCFLKGPLHNRNQMKEDPFNKGRHPYFSGVTRSAIW